MIIKSRPYRIENKIQHYDWGTKNSDAFIPKLLGTEPVKDKPYAELWIGAHDKAPSEIEIDGNFKPLNEIIEKYPKEILGESVYEKYGANLPYLLKILSAERALSIQAHPSKELAKTLHQKDRQNYPDANHKPEIAVAIDHLEAIVGFKALDEFINVIKKYEPLQHLSDSIDTSSKDFIKQFYSKLMNLSENRVNDFVDSIKEQIQKTENKAIEEIEFMRQFENFGYDVGLISILLFNFIRLETDEAVFTGAGIPHAYIKGNIIECMANSDNVVRAGLTKKYKDVPTLVDMLSYYDKPPQKIIPGNGTIKTYHTPAEEFQIVKYNSDEKAEFSIENNTTVKIGLVLGGKIKIKSDFSDSETEFRRGEAFLIPAKMKEFQFIPLCKSQFVVVEIPQ